jgi:hypothetical protein
MKMASEVTRFAHVCFRVTLGRRIRIRREKKISDHSLGQYRTSHITIFNYKPSTGPRSGLIFFFSTDSNSMTQNYPKMIYLKTILGNLYRNFITSQIISLALIYTCPSPILQIKSPVLAYRVA